MPTDDVRATIDARTLPVTITTLPAADLTPHTHRPPVTRLAAVRVLHRPQPRRHSRLPLIYGAATLALAAASGFILGVQQAGWALLVDIAHIGMALAFLGLLAATVSTVSGGRAHCPGCRTGWRPWA